MFVTLYTLYRFPKLPDVLGVAKYGVPIRDVSGSYTARNL